MRKLINYEQQLKGRICVLLICVTDKNGSLKIMNLNDNYVFIVVTKLIAENAGNSGCVP